ncbi:MAG: hypothetical protein Q9187_006683 [Circinaria calcarea]
MSGIEVVGIILGALPVVVWGLKQYKTTHDIWRRSRSKALMVDRLIEALEEQKVLIEIDLKLLLRAADIEDEEVAALNVPNYCELLQHQDVGDAVAKYLGQPLVTFQIELGPMAASGAKNAWHYAQVDVLNDDEAQFHESGSTSVEPVRRSRITINLPARDGPLRANVQNICLSLSQASRENKLLKLYLSERGQFTSCHCPPLPLSRGCVSDSAPDITTLDCLLQEAKETKDFAKRWSWNQRIVLAHRLASSLLQLHTTPWLGRSWTKQGIYFLRTHPSCAADKVALGFDANQPFITCDFPADLRSEVGSPPSAKQSLLELGILLLEIWHVTSLEAYVAEVSLDLNSTYGSRYEASKKWLDDTADNILPFYLDPVCRCIEGTFASSFPTLQWDDVELRKSVCEGVVRPLWDNCPSKTR